MPRRTRLIASATIVLALLGYLGWEAAGWGAKHPHRQATGTITPQQFQVVRTARTIRRGTKIDSGMLEVEAQTDIPQAGTFAAREQAIGRVTLVDLKAKGDLGTFNTMGEAGNLGLAPLIPKGMRAITIGVSDEIAVGNLIQPGDRVDVLLVGTSSNSGGALFRDGEARTILENQMVLAVGDTIVGEGKGNHTYRNATLAVTPQDAVRIALAGSVGSYHLSLRARDDNAPTPGFVATTSALTASTGTVIGGSGEGLTGALGPRTIEVIAGATRTTIPIGGK